MRIALSFLHMIPFLVGGYLAMALLLAVAVSKPGDSLINLAIDGVIGLFWPVAIVLAVISSAWLRLRPRPTRAFYRTRAPYSKRRGVVVYQTIQP
jgi:membrane protein implicated in regulation of membrane protease activity